MGSAGERWKVLQAAGAIGTATIMNPRPTAVTVAPAREMRLRLRRAAAGGRAAVEAARAVRVDGGRRGRFCWRTGAAGIGWAEGGDHDHADRWEKFFAGSGYTMEDILKLAMDNKPLPTFPLTGTLRVKSAVRRETVEAPNVAGMLVGSDPKLKSEYVIMSAHLDHIGVGRAINGDNIYNGAMDDASGIASILEIARIMKESGAKPKRSIIFLAVTAEEKGELGSRTLRCGRRGPETDRGGHQSGYVHAAVRAEVD